MLFRSGAPFEGGSGGDVDIVLGSGSFIPGFEEQLEGAGSGEERLVKVQFPKDYSAQNLAGKDAEFDVIVKAISSPKTLEIGEELAKKYGFESFDAMKTAVRGNLEADFEKASRDKMKRALLDVLDTRYAFDLPETLVEQEFSNIWAQHEQESRRANRTVAEEGKTEEPKADEAKADEPKAEEGEVVN